MNDEGDEEILAGLDTLARQADQLIHQFGLTITRAPAPDYGSERYRKVAHALGRLARAEVQLSELSRRVDWERMTVHGGRNGEYLVSQLTQLKKILQRMGEGAPQPKP